MENESKQKTGVISLLANPFLLHIACTPSGNCSPRPGKLVYVEDHTARVEPKFNAAENSKYKSNADTLDLVKPKQQCMRVIRGVHMLA